MTGEWQMEEEDGEEDEYDEEEELPDLMLLGDIFSLPSLSTNWQK